MHATRLSARYAAYPTMHKPAFSIYPASTILPAIGQGVGEEHAENRTKVLLLGSGWGAIPFLKYLSPTVAHTNYDITMVSPRNYFLYSPLLPGMLVIWLSTLWFELIRLAM